MIETSHIADSAAETLAMAGARIHRSLGVGGHKAPGATRVVVAMSGGVDSSVTAALMKAAGYDVVGITLQLYDHGAAVGRKGACCAGQDIHDARRVADKLGMPHYVLDYESRFRAEVMDDFADTYLAGATPIPCVRCNQRVKFRDLLQTARDLGAEALATGHYARRVVTDASVEMHRGADPTRDQSYFLFATTRAQLDFLRFPLGDLAKTATRDIAARLDLPVAAKPDSQDICFVPSGDYASVVAKLRPGAVEAGEIVHKDGRVLGRHQGIINYTVGQRRGLGLVDPASPGEPLYVLRLDPENHRVIVGPKSALAVSFDPDDRPELARPGHGSRRGIGSRRQSPFHHAGGKGDIGPGGGGGGPHLHHPPIRRISRPGRRFLCRRAPPGRRLDRPPPCLTGAAWRPISMRPAVRPVMAE